MLADELNSEESRALLTAVDRMREILHDEKIRLPEIVVVGDQSVGKSSVLEAISGIQLPRAQYICTRCPLELRMKSTTGDEYAVIRNGKSSEDQAKTINNMNDIAEEVTRLTNEIAGNGVNVSLNPIYLTVYKRDIPYDLTLIDLPGITRNPLPGQAKDIYAQILNLINKYIQPPTAVVLHVIPSSVDFTTSESMKLAKEFDPNCERQLIAVSKIDKYDKGIAEKLQGEGVGSMKLQLGCVAVLNRNQDEIDSNISFEEMKEREKQFFHKHRDAFQHLPDEYKGIDQLIKKLAIIQQARIRSTLPETIEELRKQIRSKQQELRTIPIALTSEHDCWTKFQTMINELRENIRSRVHGDYDFRTRLNLINIDGKIPSKTKSPKTVLINSKDTFVNVSTVTDDRIAYHIYKFQQQFQKEIINKFSDFLSIDYKKRVIKAIDDAAGVSLPNFPSFQIIEHLFHEEFENLPAVCFSLLENICNYIRENLLKLLQDTFDIEYSRLIQRLKEVIIKQIDEAEQRTKQRIKEILDMEYRVFTLSNEYMDMVDKITQDLNDENTAKETKKATATTTTTTTVSQTVPASTYSANLLSRASNLISNSLSGSVINDDALRNGSNEARAAPAIQIALDSYCKIVQKRLIDTISQICYYYFITQCALIIDQSLTIAITPADLIRFMKEPVDRTIRRNKLTHTLTAYEEALKVGQEYL